MDRLLGRYSELTYALFRFVFGLLFMFHGTQKLFGFPGEKDTVLLLSQYGLAGVIEFAGGLMIALGFYAGHAAFIASGLMAFAYFLAHAPQGTYPILNRGELSILYSFAFLFMASKGSGKYSIDSMRRGKRG
jgi:putative oxidoreductase